MLDTKNVKLRTEEEIVSSWVDKEKIVVSVVCATYNHELYIEDAITGFLLQETNFAFEVIIYDDASTDNTANIVQTYHDKYPTIIKFIQAKENQYSKGGFKPSPYAASFSRGDYVAVCEGDDFWCSARKLQDQFSAMDQYKEIDLCVHSVYSRLPDGSSIIITKHHEHNTLLKVEDFITGGGGFVATPSLFIRKSVLDNLPDWFYSDAPVGDYYIQILSSYRHGALYLSEPMSVYRRDVENSWSSRNLKRLHQVVVIREKMLRANSLCEEELSDLRLFEAFTIANFNQFKSCMIAKYQIASKVDSFKLFIKLFQFRFLLLPLFKIRQKFF